MPCGSELHYALTLLVETITVAPCVLTQLTVVTYILRRKIEFKNHGVIILHHNFNFVLKNYYNHDDDVTFFWVTLHQTKCFLTSGEQEVIRGISAARQYTCMYVCIFMMLVSHTFYL